MAIAIASVCPAAPSFTSMDFTRAIQLGGIPLSLSTSVGTLLAGLVCGYLRSAFRAFGRIPEPALWVLNNVGLNGFIAAVGLSGIVLLMK